MAVRLSGKQKAAIILMLLGLEDASLITQHMNHFDVRQLAEISAEMKNISKEQLNQVLMEFMQMLPDENDTIVFEKDFSSEILKRSYGNEQLFSLDFLQRADQKQLLEIIIHEHPQVIAFVVSYLPPDQASSLLSALPERIQAEIAYRISSMESPSHWVLKLLDRMLGEKLNLLASSKAVEVGGVDSLVKIMRGVGRNSEKVIIEQLEEDYPELAEEIRSQMFVFEDMVQLEAKSIQKVLKDVNMSTLALAMKKASDEIKELIMNNLSERASKVLQEDIESMGKVPLREVEAAQQEIVETIRRMEEAGEITVRKQEEVYV
ncbi:MAG: flagellar motor switch protein FliG [Vulcanimicrobiota bacterium]